MTSVSKVLLFSAPQRLRGKKITVACSNLQLPTYPICCNVLLVLPHHKSRQLHARALRVIPGGVNSPVRAFKSVACDPPYIVRGSGSHIWDADDNEYIDYV